MCLFAFIIVMGDVWRKICCFPTWFKMYYFSGQRRRSIEGVGGVCHFFCVVPSSSCCSPQFNGRFTLLYFGSPCFTLLHCRCSFYAQGRGKPSERISIVSVYLLCCAVLSAASKPSDFLKFEPYFAILLIIFRPCLAFPVTWRLLEVFIAFQTKLLFTTRLWHSFGTPPASFRACCKRKLRVIHLAQLHRNRLILWPHFAILLIIFRPCLVVPVTWRLLKVSAVFKIKLFLFTTRSWHSFGDSTSVV